MGTAISHLHLLRSITVTSGVSKDYLESSTLTLINPHRRQFHGDTTSVSIPAEKVKQLNDEEILALFTRGFFSGPVFKFESLLLMHGRYNPFGIPSFRDIKHDNIQQHISRPWNLPNSCLLVPGSTILSAFQVVATHLPTGARHGPSYPFIDLAYGSVTSSFSGCHRFSVHRTPTASLPVEPATSLATPAGQVSVDSVERKGEEEEARLMRGEGREGKEQVGIRMESVYGNPTRASGGDWIEWRIVGWFHRCYAKALVWDGARAVVRGGEERKRA